MQEIIQLRNVFIIVIWVIKWLCSPQEWLSQADAHFGDPAENRASLLT